MYACHKCMHVINVCMLKSARCTFWLVMMCMACGSGVDIWILGWIRWAWGWICISGRKEYIYNMRTIKMCTNGP